MMADCQSCYYLQTVYPWRDGRRLPCSAPAVQCYQLAFGARLKPRADRQQEWRAGDWREAKTQYPCGFWQPNAKGTIDDEQFDLEQ